jgi:hypothetical protein
MDHGLRSTGEKKSLRHQVYPTRAGSRKGLISRFRAFGVCSVGPSTSATIGNTQRFSGGIFQCRAIVPNSSARRASGGVLPSSAVSPHRPRHLLAPIDWGQSIYQKSQRCTKQALGYRSTTISTPKFLITILHQVGHFLIDKESKYSF